jgi:hypothetical protein
LAVCVYLLDGKQTTFCPQDGKFFLALLDGKQTTFCLLGSTDKLAHLYIGVSVAIILISKTKDDL